MALSVSRKRVERLMREAGLQGAFLRKRWRTGSTRQDPNYTSIRFSQRLADHKMLASMGRSAIHTTTR